MPVNLRTFGPIGTPEEAQKTLEQGIRQLQAIGGGVIMIPSDAPAAWRPQNDLQEVVRTPPAPGPATNWGAGPGVTLIDARQHRIILPQVTGMTFLRTFSLPQKDSSPHWQYHPMVPIKTNVLKTAGYYRGVLLDGVAAGKDRRLYVDSIQGLFPGQALRVSTKGPSDVPPSAGENVQPSQVQVKELGYDSKKRQPYFLADIASSIPIGATLSAHTSLSTIRASTRANNELQTFDIYNIREHFSQGDSYLYHGRIFYMGNEYSPREEIADKGVEARSGYGSVIYDARVTSETNIFRGVVESISAQTGELRYQDAANAHTLATGRPLINLNPRTWITQGHAYVRTGGGTPLGYSWHVGSVDAPWTQEIVGRYIALDDPSEYVPTGDKVRRWYLITGMRERDGTKELTLQRFWWGAKFGSMAALYNWNNYTSNTNNPVLLNYIIAPGTNVYDVADGVGLDETQSAGGGKRVVRLAPYPQTGTALDFQAGDPVEQAIGPDPFRPIPFRAWLFDQVPGVFPAPVFDVLNGGSITRSSVLSISGKGGYGSAVSFYDGAANHLLRVRGGAENLMLLRFDTLPREALLTAVEWVLLSPKRVTGRVALDQHTGAITLNRPVDLRGSGIIQVAGLSQERHHTSKNIEERPKRDFRDIGAPVPVGSKEVRIDLPNSKAGQRYAVKVEPNWLTDYAVTNETNGFRVQFDVAAPANARITWIVVR